MSAKEKTSTLRLLALAAFILAAGLLSLRAYDLFGSVKSEPIGSSVERELTYLLEPITGTDRVRVSVTGRTPKTVLVMVDGDVASDLRSLRARVESVLSASIAFDPQADTLTLSQFPFARGVGGTLEPLQIAELTGLGLLSLILLVALLSPQKQIVTAAAAPEPRLAEPQYARPVRLPAPQVNADEDLHAASSLAETKPNETANLVRGWMSYSEE